MMTEFPVEVLISAEPVTKETITSVEGKVIMVM